MNVAEEITLHDAVAANRTRQQIAVDGGGTPAEVARQSSVGFDLNMDCVTECAQDAAMSATAAVHSGAAPMLVLRTLYMSALLDGLMLAQMRAQAERKAEDDDPDALRRRAALLLVRARDLEEGHTP